MLTDDGSSETLTSSWDKSDDQNPAIFYVWRRFPSGERAIQPRSDSPTYIHYGAGVLEVCGDSPFQLRGLYWTIEGVTGEMNFSSHNGKLCKSYDEAVALFDQ